MMFKKRIKNVYIGRFVYQVKAVEIKQKAHDNK